MLLVIVLATGSVIDGMFGLVIVANSGIGIIQEFRAKRTLDELASRRGEARWSAATGRFVAVAP